MTDRMRWRYGETNPIEANVLSKTVIEVGDMLWRDHGGDAKPAIDFQTGMHCDVESAVESFSSSFLGIAMTRSREGETSPIRIATNGIFEMDCRIAKFEEGDFVGPDLNAIKATLRAGQPVRIPNQEVAKVSHRDLAIGRVVKRSAIAVPTVLVSIIGCRKLKPVKTEIA